MAGTTRGSKKSRAGSSACLDGPMYVLVPTHEDVIAAVLGSASLVILIESNRDDPGFVALLSESWLHGAFDII